MRDDAAGRRVGRIVEVEAYIGEDDRASHARFGPTVRNAAMFGEAGRAYLYLVYGMHVCLNIVTEPPGHPAAILVRAVRLVEGVEMARSARLDRTAATRRTPLDRTARAVIARRLSALPPERLAAGPGLVGAAFDLSAAMTGLDLCDPRQSIRLEVAPSSEPRPEIATGPRIGIAYAGQPWIDLPWRFWIAGDRSVSRPGSLG